MRVLVTGGLGFLGRAVVAELRAAGHTPAVLTHRVGDVAAPDGVEVVRADVRNRAAVDAAVVMRRNARKFDGICHLAGLARARDSVVDPLAYWDTNVTGTLNVLHAASYDGTPVVSASTNVVYGSRTTGALHEGLDPHPESPYAATKWAGEQATAAWATAGAAGAVSLRFFNIAGAVGGVTDTDTTRIIPNVFRALTGEARNVVLNGDGSAVRDFVHVADCAVAVRLALETTRASGHRLYNVGSGVGTSMAEVVTAAAQVVGRPVPTKRADPKPEPHTLVADIGLIERELGWKPARSSLTEILSDAWSAWPQPNSSRTGHRTTRH